MMRIIRRLLVAMNEVSLFGFQGAGVRKHISGEIKSKDQRGKDSRVRGKKAIEAYSLFSKESTRL